MSVTSRRVARVTALVALAVATLGAPGSASGATALVSLELHMVPNPAPIFAQVVFSGAVNRVSGSPTNVGIRLELPGSYSSGACQPACSSIFTSHFDWVFPGDKRPVHVDRRPAAGGRTVGDERNGAGGRRTIVVKVLTSRGRQRIDVDAFLTTR